MGRIDEALKRARRMKGDRVGGADESPGGPGRPGPTPVPPRDLFVAPWHFTSADEAPEAPREAAGPAPEPAEPAVPPRPEGIVSEEQPAATSPAEGPSTVPRSLAPMALRQVDPGLAEKFVTSPHASSVSVEQYRKLASSLHYAQTERGVKVVMVASAMEGEGKSLTATNLALTLSESYHRRVLLIDADLRKPTLHEIFRVPNTSGLSDGLRAVGDAKLSVIQLSQYLVLLPAGRPDSDPMAGLISERMHRAVTEAAARFDWVVIDTPPVGLLPDANLLTGMVDTAILVVRADDTPYDLVRKAIEALGRDKILGIVLNRAEEGVVYSYRRYYRYYKYSASERRKR
jgi:protein-tyrosine kinase